MRRWQVFLVFLIGVALGAAGAVLGPRLAAPYLPESVRGPVQRVEGPVVRKQREADRLLLTIVSAQGATLATFKERVPEITLLVEEGDTVTLTVPQYRPFLEDPAIERVQKPKPAPRPEAGGPLPPAAGEKPLEEKAPR